IRHEGVRMRELSSREGTAEGVARLRVRAAVPEEGDPDNRLLRLDADRHTGVDGSARLPALLESLYGSTSGAVMIGRRNEAVQAASRAAKKELPALRAAFRAGMAPGEYLTVKCPFAVPGGGEDYMWVEVTAWDGDEIRGILRNEPQHAPGLQHGQLVTVSMATVFDYI